MIIKDRVIKYGNNVDTDVIIPARYLNTTGLAERGGKLSSYHEAYDDGIRCRIQICPTHARGKPAQSPVKRIRFG